MLSFLHFRPELLKRRRIKTDSFKIQSIPFVRPGTGAPFLTAGSVYVIDLVSITPLFEKNPHARLYPASTVKVITALTAADSMRFDDVLTVKRVIEEGQVMDLVKMKK